MAETFHSEGDGMFWNVHDPAGVVVIDLAGECYSPRGYREQEPAATVAAIQRVPGPRGG